MKWSYFKVKLNFQPKMSLLKITQKNEILIFRKNRIYVTIKICDDLVSKLPTLLIENWQN